ncbi:Ribonucleoside-diphosphate reductase 2 subunit beta [Weissella viridescens]|uniref:Ribonucleoside-diphosphate reductase 2 subunit beta n=1 Tax=Weissella viridescens TaxID=1629 RepID=A0A380P7U7_WEIVI|nr:Ribonucleoside-diphosphate reductase 2 subunit beta [Weissella viridescens]
MQRKIASVFLETFLFYSGFYTPLYYLGHNKLNNVAEIIKLILRDESVHGTYIGYKFQLGFNELSEAEQADLKMWMYDLVFDLYSNEESILMNYMMRLVGPIQCLHSYATMPIRR